MDEVLRWSILGSLGFAAAVLLLGGLLTRVSGLWVDGDRRIVLRQLGPWVRGWAEIRGGEAIYSGLALFGRVTLGRRDSGREHLLAIGFDEDTLSQVAGSVTARFRFRLHSDALHGTFQGMHFKFHGTPRKLVGTNLTEPTDRTWQRVVPGFQPHGS